MDNRWICFVIVRILTCSDQVNFTGCYKIQKWLRFFRIHFTTILINIQKCLPEKGVGPGDIFTPLTTGLTPPLGDFLACSSNTLVESFKKYFRRFKYCSFCVSTELWTVCNRPANAIKLSWSLLIVNASSEKEFDNGIVHSGLLGASPRSHHINETNPVFELCSF